MGIGHHYVCIGYHDNHDQHDHHHQHDPPDHHDNHDRHDQPDLVTWSAWAKVTWYHVCVGYNCIACGTSGLRSEDYDYEDYYNQQYSEYYTHKHHENVDHDENKDSGDDAADGDEGADLEFVATVATGGRVNFLSAV